MEIKNFFKKNILVILSLIFLAVFSGALQLFASGPPYGPGDTLDPGCDPLSDPITCIVTIPTSPISIVNNNSLFSIGLHGGESADAVGSIFFGDLAGQNASNASHSVFLGEQSGLVATNASHSIFLGSDAGNGAIGANNSIFIGNKAGANDTVNNIAGSTSILIGDNTKTGGKINSIVLGANGTNTKDNQFLVPASYVNWQIAGLDYVMPTVPGLNTQVLKTDSNGVLSWGNDSVGTAFTVDLNNNMYAGNGAGAALLNGNDNLAIGESALPSDTDGQSNTAIGGYSLLLNTTGDQNTAIGVYSLFYNKGSKNTALGYGADVVNWMGAIYQNATAIGYNAKVGASNSLVLGGTGDDAVKVGIGITIPTNVLSVIGKADDTTVMNIGNVNTSCSFSILTSSFSCPSDERLKNNITSIDNVSALDDLNKLNPVMFHYNWQDPEAPLIPGFIAQEFENTFPNMVSTDKTTGFKSLSYTPLIPYAVKAIQELDLKIEDLAIKTTGESLNPNGFFDRFINWFADTGNNIGDFFANRIRTKEICLTDNGGDETCINKTQLDEILSGQNQNYNQNQNQNQDNSGSGQTNPPTCSDGIQNQDETGVDTGGSCPPAEEPVVDPNPVTP